MQTGLARATERGFDALYDTIEHVSAQRHELGELRGFVLTRRSPIGLAMSFLATLPALALSVAFLTAADWLPHRWPTPREAGDVAATASEWMLVLIAFFAVVALVQVCVGRGGQRSLAAARQLHVTTSPLNRITIARSARPGSRPLANPIGRRVDVAALVLDRAAAEALMLVALAAELVLAIGDVPPVITAALLTGAAPTLVERLLAAIQLLRGLRDRRRNVGVRLHAIADVNLTPRDVDGLRRSAPYN